MNAIRIWQDEIVSAIDMPNGHTRITMIMDSAIYCCVTDYYHKSMRDRGYVVIRFE